MKCDSIVVFLYWEIAYGQQREDDIRYYQFAETVRDETTRTREYAPLLAIRDHYPKTLITLDMDLPASNNGVHQVNAYDFLLEGE